MRGFGRSGWGGDEKPIGHQTLFRNTLQAMRYAPDTTWQDSTEVGEFVGDVVQWLADKQFIADPQEMNEGLSELIRKKCIDMIKQFEYTRDNEGILAFSDDYVMLTIGAGVAAMLAQFLLSVYKACRTKKKTYTLDRVPRSRGDDSE